MISLEGSVVVEFGIHCGAGYSHNLQTTIRYAFNRSIHGKHTPRLRSFTPNSTPSPKDFEEVSSGY
jgi:hypothetical protein